MVAQLLRLKLRLLGNGLRRSPWQVVGLLLAVLNAVAVLVLVTIGLLAVRRISVEFWDLTVVFGGAMLVMAWWVVPLIAFGLDSTLDPQRFATFSVPRRDLLAGLGLSALIGVPGMLTLLVLVMVVLVWLPDVPGAIAALVCGVVALATCVVGSRAMTTALAPLLESRRFREVSGVVALLPVMLIGPILIQIAAATRVGQDVIPDIVETLSWTPLGAVWAVSVDVSHGAWARAGAHLAIALATLSALVWLWDRFLQRALVTPPTGSSGLVRSLGLGGFAHARTPVTAVAARCLTYWFRDTRYIGNLAMIPVLPVVLALLFDRSSGLLMLLLPALCAFLLGWAISADVAYDSTAFWLHVSTGVSGRDDRLGRVLALSVVAVPALAVLIVGAAWYTGAWAVVPVAVGLALGVLGATVGLASVVSARFIYAVPKPGDGPFKAPQGSAMANLVVQGLSWLLLVLLLLPQIALAAFAFRSGGTVATWLTLAGGVTVGGLLLAYGIRLGGRIYDVRAPLLMEEVIGQD